VQVESATERTCFHSLGAFKTYDNLCEGENQVIPIQQTMSGEEYGDSRPGEGGLGHPWATYI
jgi:hypothetical protein